MHLEHKVNHMEQQQYLDNYEQTLTQKLVQLLTGIGRLEGQLLPSEDLDNLWEPLARGYLPDGIREIAQYPTVSLGWMMYIGMAVAHMWDKDWALLQKQPDAYLWLQQPRGFDAMDEHIVQDILKLQGEDAERLEEVVRTAATLALTQIRREGIEPQSPMAFHVYVRSIHALYLTGISMELKRLGYSYKAAQ